MARRATIIKNARATAEHFLVLDAGDTLLSQGNLAHMTRGATTVEALNLLGYDAVGLGMTDLAYLTPEDLLQRQQEARFPFVSANVVAKATDELVAEPYVLLDIADHRVAILGVTEQGVTDEFEAGDPLQAVGEYLPALRREADLVILLSHAGLQVDHQIAAQMPGIDLIVGGGTEMNDEPEIVGGTKTMIVHADIPRPGEAGRTVGLAQLVVGPDGAIAEHQWERIWLLSDIADDAEMAALLRSHKE